MHCIGVDIVEIARLEEAVARWGEDFLRRVYTDSELKLYRQKGRARKPALKILKCYPAPAASRWSISTAGRSSRPS
jgi:holo-[acyl-carrier-protein] synthase